jgi:hypothetical protein
VSALPSVSASARPSSELEALEAAPALVYRQLDTGAIMGKNQLVTHRLHQAEGRALLIVETRSSKRAMALTPERIEPLGPATVRRFSGTVRTVGTLTTFELADGADVLSLECEMGSVRVASATAVREREGRNQCEGDRGRWVPAATKPVRALRCGIDREPDPVFKPDRLEKMAFLEAPGLEFLWVNDDCAMQGGGYRLVPADESVHAVRKPG